MCWAWSYVSEIQNADLRAPLWIGKLLTLFSKSFQAADQKIVLLGEIIGALLQLRGWAMLAIKQKKKKNLGPLPIPPQISSMDHQTEDVHILKG